MLIRDAKKGDIEKINKIYNQVVKSSNVTFDLEPFSIEKQHNWYKKHKKEGYPIIVAEVDNIVVGWASLSRWSDKKGYDYTAENSVYVDKADRGQGIGYKLLKKLIEKAKQKNIKNLIALITEGNQGSINLHKKFAYEKVGNLKKVGHKFNQYYDVEIYQLIVSE